MPFDGYEGAQNGPYRAKHNPWRDFSNLPTSTNKTFNSFPSDYNNLPTVSIVVPDQNNDMHDGTIRQADDWLKNNFDSYVQWAKTHNSVLIVVSGLTLKFTILDVTLEPNSQY